MKFYKWHSIVDENTCVRCRVLHDKILTEQEIEELHPPLHGPDKEGKDGCRCSLVEISEEEYIIRNGDACACCGRIFGPEDTIVADRHEKCIGKPEMRFGNKHLR